MGIFSADDDFLVWLNAGSETLFQLNFNNFHGRHTVNFFLFHDFFCFQINMFRSYLVCFVLTSAIPKFLASKTAFRKLFAANSLFQDEGYRIFLYIINQTSERIYTKHPHMILPSFFPAAKVLNNNTRGTNQWKKNKIFHTKLIINDKNFQLKTVLYNRVRRHQSLFAVCCRFVSAAGKSPAQPMPPAIQEVANCKKTTPFRLFTSHGRKTAHDFN